MTTPWQPGFQGVTVVSPTYNDPHNYSPVSALQLVAQTPVAGYTLINGTGAVAGLAWSAPADNQLHIVHIVAVQHVTSLETGGAISYFTTLPDGTAANGQVFAGGSAAGPFRSTVDGVVAPGSTVSITQSSALTAGAAVLWVQIWAA